LALFIIKKNTLEKGQRDCYTKNKFVPVWGTELAFIDKGEKP